MRFCGDNCAATKTLLLAAVVCLTVVTSRETITTIGTITNLSGRLGTYGPDVCGGPRNDSSSPPPLLLLIVVDTVADHADQRQEIRFAWYTWLSRWNALNGGGGGGGGGVRLMFFSSKPRTRRAAQRLREENAASGDGRGGDGYVVWTNVTDAAEHETLKAVALLRWVRSECRAARFVLRVAEHVIVNPGPLMDFVRTRANATNTVWGYERQRYRPGVNQVKEESFCDWPAYLMTSDTVDVLYRESLKTIKYDQEQNVFITGILAKDTHVNLTYIDQFRGIVLSKALAPTGVNVSDSNRYYFKNHFIFVTFFNKNEFAYLMTKYFECNN